MADDIQVVVTEGSPAEVVVEPEPDTTVTVTLPPPVQTVEIEVPGPAGPPGPPGELVTGTGDLFYEFTQSLASATWGPINHALGKFPSVTVVDSANSVVVGDVVYIDDSHVTLEFSAPFSGVAYLN